MDLKKKTGHLLICGWKPGMEKIVCDILSSNKKMTAGDLVIVANVSQEEADRLKVNEGMDKINIIRGEHFNESVLRMANVSKARKAIIISDLISQKTPDEIDSQTMMTAMAIDSLGGTYVCAELLNPKYEKYLKLANCDEIIYSSEYSRSLIANASSSTGIVNIYHNLLDPNSSSRLYTSAIPSDYINKTYSELAEYFRSKAGSVLIGVLENTGSRNALRESAIKEAQKTPDISKLVDNLVSVKKLSYNNPVFTPADTYVVLHNSMAILVGADHANR